MEFLNAKVVGRTIQKTREHKGLSQEVVSGLADIGRTHLSAIERGERKPTLETFFRLADALGMPASSLMKKIEATLADEESIETAGAGMTARETVPKRSDAPANEST